jgi:hypothetical protein
VGEVVCGAPCGDLDLAPAATRQIPCAEILGDYSISPYRGGLFHCGLRAANLIDPGGRIWAIDLNDCV